MVIEKCVGRANSIDCLLEIRELVSADKCSMSELPTAWRTKLYGKRIVVFYIGTHTIYHFRTNLQDVYRNIGYVMRVFENSEGNALIWLDDGLLKSSIEHIQDEAYCASALKAEENILKYITDSSSVVRATDDDMFQLFEMADIYYGDDGEFCELAKERQLKIIPFDCTGQSYMRFMDIEEWLKYIENPYDFTIIRPDNKLEKRLILFYMCPQSLLEQKKSALEKLERVTAIARARKSLKFCWVEEHMSKKLLHVLPMGDRNRYVEAREAFLKAGDIVEIGSNDFRKVIKRVNIYYGDSSFALHAYQRQGVPVVEQCYENHIRQHIAPSLQGNSMGVQMGQGCWLDNCYYFSLNVGNGLCRLARGSDMVEYLAPIPCCNDYDRHTDLFSVVVHYAQRMYLVPNGARNFAIYDMNYHSWRTLPLDNRFVINKKNNYIFSSAVIVGNALWCIPNSYGAIVKFDLLTEKVTYFTDWHKEIQRYIKLPDSTHWSGRAVLVDGKLYFSANQSPHIICFDTENESSTVYRLDIDATGLGFLVYDGKDFWSITVREGKDRLVRWHPDKGVTLVVDDVLGKDSRGGSLIAHSNSIWIFENQNDTYARYDLATGQLMLREHYLPLELREGLGAANLIADESFIYILPNWGELLVKLNPRTEEVEAFSPRLDEMGQKSYIKECFAKDVVSESEFADDNELALYLENVELKRKETLSVGSSIYQEIIGIK